MDFFFLKYLRDDQEQPFKAFLSKTRGWLERRIETNLGPHPRFWAEKKAFSGFAAQPGLAARCSFLLLQVSPQFWLAAVLGSSLLASKSGLRWVANLAAGAAGGRGGRFL